MTRLHLIPLLMACLGAGCGSFDNQPLLTGTIRGQLANTDTSALVSVIGHEALVTAPDAEGRFALEGVPLGTAELFVVINLRESRRFTVEVGAASIVELGPVEPALSGDFEVYVKAPGGQRVTGGQAVLVGTPLVVSIKPPEDEAEFHLPAGCYETILTVPGLGSGSISGCIEAAGLFERNLLLEPPDGSPGREGCVVTGCQGLLTCQADRSCR